MRKKRIVSLLTGAITALAAQAAAPAPDSIPAEHAPHTLNEIEVLGVKTMPTPGNSAVTRINAATIRRLNIEAVKDVGEIVPNLYSPNYGSRMTSSIYMRGLGSRIDQAVVGLSVDGVPLLNKDAYDFDIADMARIEVLRGAQSVLNGRNSMAGQINVYTLSPRDYRGIRAKVEYARANTFRGALGGYFKLRPGLYTSLTAQIHHTDGYWKNTFSHWNEEGDNAQAQNSFNARWKTVWAPSSALSATNTMTYSTDRQEGYPYADARTGIIAYNDTCFYRRQKFADGLTIAWAGERVVVTSLTSVQYLDDRLQLDQDFTTNDYFTLTQARREWTFTEDLFTKGTRGDYSWLGGVFGFYRHGSMSAPVTFFDDGLRELIEKRRNEMNPTYPISWDERTFLLGSHFTTPSGGFALYHQSRYDLDDWSFEAGLRWDFERVTCDYRSRADASYTTWHVTDGGDREFFKNTPVDIDEQGRMKQTFNQLLPKAGVARMFPWGRVYASFSKGYKSGGYNTQMFSDVLQQKVMSSMGLSAQYNAADIVAYRPETSLNYELGVKGQWLNGRLSAGADIFFISCRDQQLTIFPPGTVTGRVMANAGRTRSMGAEASATWEPVEQFTLQASYGYTDATFRSYNDGRQDYRGNRVPFAPAHTLFASATWRMPWSPGRGVRPVLNVNVRGVGDIYWNEANSARQPFYATAGASAALEAPDWTVRLWGTNITNTRYNAFYFTSVGNSFIQRGNPWCIGATLQININKN